MSDLLPEVKNLAIYLDYGVEEGMDANMAELIMTRIMDILPDKPYQQFYANDVFRFQYASHIAEQSVAVLP